MTICLGIESTAHTFGAGVVGDWGEILSNVKSTYKPPEGWGIDPSKAKEHHKMKADEIIKEAIKQAHIEKPDIIAISAGPGLPPTLKVGMLKAKELAKKLGIPLVPVNHCIAHLEIGKLNSKSTDPVMLYVSGGNTQVIAFENGKYRIFGETEDIGIGNLFDTFGREAKIEFPAGPKIDALAQKGEKYIQLPYVVKGMDVSFTGIQTVVKNLLGKEKIEDICYSLEETVYAMLLEVTERAMAHTQKDELILTGGVAASARLREMCDIMCKERGARFFPVELAYAGDNGAMIAWNGILAAKNATKKYSTLDIKPRWRTDDVEISWK